MAATTGSDALAKAQFEAEQQLMKTLQVRLAAALDNKRAAEAEARAAADRVQDTALAVQSAEAALKSFQDTISQSRALLGPLPTYPFDILAEIFRAWSATGVYSLDHNGRYIPPAFAAASVCRRWRTVATSIASIWALVTIDFDNLRNVHEYIELLLERNRTVALDVALIEVPLVLRRQESIEERLLLQLLARSRNLVVKYVHDFSPNLAFHGSILPYLQVPMPKLEVLEIKSDKHRGLDPVPVGTQLLTLAPQLKSLQLSIDLFSLLEPQTLPNIESLQATDALSSRQLAHISRTWPRLKQLTAVMLPCAPGDALVQLPNLDTLTCINYVTPFPLLNVQSVPKLSTLQLIGAPTEFLAFIRTGTFTSLRWLRLKAFTNGELPNMPVDPLNTRLLELVSGDALSAMPNMTRLGLMCFQPRLLQQFLQIWSVSETSRLHPKKLQSLDIFDAAFDVVAAQALLNFLALRREKGVAIQVVEILEDSIHDDEIFPEWMLPQLQRLVPAAVIERRRDD